MNRNVIGHGQITSFLDRAWTNGKLAHAYLLTGPDGVGKATLARWFVGRVLGAERPEIHPDFLLVERGDDPKTGKPRKDIALEQVQHLVGWLSLGAMGSGWKAVVLEGAQHLNKESGNALLKSLEEPKEKTVLLLTADSADSVLPTVRSRCQIVALGRVPEEAIAEAMRAAGATDEDAQLLARLSSGCPGRALTYFNEPDRLAAMLDQRNRLLDALEAGLADRWLALESNVPEKLPFNEATDRARETLALLAELLQDALFAANGCPELVTHLDVRERIAAWASRVGSSRIAATLEALEESRRMLSENVAGRVALGCLAAATAK
ncbi:MAG: DNA polymerase III subunit delta' C-terminal domain-containing protein [Patescibacteria group bacterium]|nr:DNA polymerase III subunit delta' C-terminal domain-containing protein [Patescibacteria group bacterium]